MCLCCPRPSRGSVGGTSRPPEFPARGWGRGRGDGQGGHGHGHRSFQPRPAEHGPAAPQNTPAGPQRTPHTPRPGVHPLEAPPRPPRTPFPPSRPGKAPPAALGKAGGTALPRPWRPEGLGDTHPPPPEPEEFKGLRKSPLQVYKSFYLLLVRPRMGQ